MIVFKNINIFGEAELQENSKKKIELMNVHKPIKTIRNKTKIKKRTAENKLPCAKAQRIENAAC